MAICSRQNIQQALVGNSDWDEFKDLRQGTLIASNNTGFLDVPILTPAFTKYIEENL